MLPMEPGFAWSLVRRSNNDVLCRNMSATTTVRVYYAPWFDDDGKAVEGGTRYDEQTFTVPALPPGQVYSITWTGTARAPGKYYFVATVDPDNTLGVQRTHRSVFLVTK